MIDVFLLAILQSPGSDHADRVKSHLMHRSPFTSYANAKKCFLQVKGTRCCLSVSIRPRPARSCCRCEHSLVVRTPSSGFTAATRVWAQTRLRILHARGAVHIDMFTPRTSTGQLDPHPTRRERLPAFFQLRRSGLRARLLACVEQHRGGELWLLICASRCAGGSDRGLAPPQWAATGIRRLVKMATLTCNIVQTAK